MGRKNPVDKKHNSHASRWHRRLWHENFGAFKRRVEWRERNENVSNAQNGKEFHSTRKRVS